jgi:hypothetical protein
MADKDVLAEAQQAFQDCEEAENENRLAALDDLRFAKLGEQWPEKIRQQRIKDGRPCLTINRQPSFIRQVVNEARQNRPSIKVHPVDSQADVQIAEIYNGLIRNIEQTSKADVAYDTGVDFAVSMGFGYWRISIDLAYDDTFDKDILIERIANPFSVYGDPLSTAADSCDWNQCFVTEVLGEKAFEQKYKGADKVSWEDDYKGCQAPWYADKTVMVAEWWKREKVPKTIMALSDGSVLAEDVYAKQKELLDAQGVTVLGSRKTQSYKVTQKVLTGAEVLEEVEWAGKYIPIIPVYGDEVNVEGKRHFRSLIRDAKDAQRMLNYWRTASTELTALAPRVPFIGKKGTFKSDASKWATVNSQNHAFIEYDGADPPARQPLDSGRAIGAIQEALNAQDDMKSILGIYDASLGAQGNETSGKAILARQQESNASNFHFIDNLSRAIEHSGRVMIDLIPKVYTGERMIRVLGHDNKAQNVQLGQQMPVQGPDGQPQQDPATGLPMTKVCDLSAGKYDLTVEVGPSSATKREEIAQRLTEIVQAFPAAAPLVSDIIVRNLDIPDGDEIAKRFEAMLPPQVTGQNQDPMQNPRVQETMQKVGEQAQKLQQQVQDLTLQNQSLQQDSANEARKLEIEAFKAQTDRMQAVHQMTQPSKIAATTEH